MQECDRISGFSDLSIKNKQEPCTKTKENWDYLCGKACNLWTEINRPKLLLPVAIFCIMLLQEFFWYIGALFCVAQNWSYFPNFFQMQFFSLLSENGKTYLLFSVKFLTKLTISKSHFWQNLIFQKIHIFKVSFLTKLTFLWSNIPQNSHFQSLIFHKIHIFQRSSSW